MGSSKKGSTTAKIFGFFFDLEDYFDELPKRKFALNNRFSNFGYSSMLTLQNMGFTFFILFLQISAMILIVFGFRGRKTSLLSSGYSILTDLVLFGYILNLILISYLPILIILLLGVAGIRWEGENVNGQVRFNNVVTLFLTIIHLSMPFILMINLYRNKSKIGVFKKLNFQFVIDQILEIDERK